MMGANNVPIPLGAAEQFRKRAETIRLLTLLTGSGPLILTAVAFIAWAMVVIGVIQHAPDSAALTVALILTPICGLLWLLRSLVNNLLANLDICLEQHDPDSPRP